MHKIDEYVSISDLRKLTKIYHQILVEYFKWNSIKLKSQT
jgi:acetylornithine deacetylase/succinyl-diaminopimelate desuccinylase-like protein